ncbi:hypothetical protein [Propionimicrobium sp. PCR01-08-3]|uniref:hypothetical protein n=1 Tax=Propionimicrobium sp. PCR01-08-3 TaxID=3052086 RepID=UPI00255CE0B2|nr:hypothetical protein [Propionimicrobium sp. PCR01-08-3]WIY82816.1 hypothetical protein QQ658_00165 [Propionimicrobium sp. PCR01-08-3]
MARKKTRITSGLIYDYSCPVCRDVAALEIGHLTAASGPDPVTMMMSPLGWFTAILVVLFGHGQLLIWLPIMAALLLVIVVLITLKELKKMPWYLDKERAENLLDGLYEAKPGSACERHCPTNAPEPSAETLEPVGRTVVQFGRLRVSRIPYGKELNVARSLDLGRRSGTS